MGEAIKMQKPAGGCENCGGPVRTWKPLHGWTCTKCVKEINVGLDAAGLRAEHDEMAIVLEAYKVR